MTIDRMQTLAIATAFVVVLLLTALSVPLDLQPGYTIALAILSAGFFVGGALYEVAQLQRQRSVDSTEAILVALDRLAATQSDSIGNLANTIAAVSRK